MISFRRQHTIQIENIDNNCNKQINYNNNNYNNNNNNTIIPTYIESNKHNRWEEKNWNQNQRKVNKIEQQRMNIQL